VPTRQTDENSQERLDGGPRDDKKDENLQAAAPRLMPEFVYQAGMVVGRDSDDRRAYLAAFGRNLKIQRTKLGLSQEQFADLIGMHRTFVGQLERGQHGVNVAELPKIAQALGVCQADLLPEAIDRPVGPADPNPA
jgi:DNA-binding XRE family transcriptional regulator